MHKTGDVGADCNTTVKALEMFGVPPDKYWPYTDITLDFDKEPLSYWDAFRHCFKVVSCDKLATPGISNDDLLTRIKMNLAAEWPLMFAFMAYRSTTRASSSGKISFPCPKDEVMGGMAVAAVGYDDTIKIESECESPTTGAILFAISWGSQWGDNGYGWLAYDFVLKARTVDWWALKKPNGSIKASLKIIQVNTEINSLH